LTSMSYHYLHKSRPKEAPVGYVAGLGRGATGFTTRSDIGPARAPTDVADKGSTPPAGYVAGRGRGADSLSKGRDDEDNDVRMLDTEALGDHEVGLFDGHGYDADDAEADAVWDAIDDRMDSQRKDRREKKERAQVLEMRRERPKIQAQFASLKAGLSEVTYEEWESLREPGAQARSKRQKLDRYTPVPTSLLEQARAESQVGTHVDLKTQMGYQTPGWATSGYATSGFQTPGYQTPGFNTPWGNQTATGDVPMVGHAKQTIIRAKLEQASESITGQTAINPKGYLTDLNSQVYKTTAEVGDIKIAAKLLDSVCKANPTHAPGWIARARLDESAGKLTSARKIIMQGCQNCPKSQDVWLEAANLHEPEEAKSILGQACHHLPNSVPLWQAAANLETEIKKKQAVLTRALEHIPNSPTLWRAAVELYEPGEAKLMLAHAVKCIPTSVDMWLALAKLETYDNAKKILNKACSTIPTEKSIWITAARLEEANHNIEVVGKVIHKAVRSLSANGVQIDREQWIKEAEQCEKNNSKITCQAIIKETIGQDVEEEDRKSTWCEDAENAVVRGSIETARAIYNHATQVFPYKKSLWLRMCHLEKRYGDSASVDKVLACAVQNCPKEDVLWLMYAKHKWVGGDVAAARQILSDAFNTLMGNEKIWLAAVKLEKENEEFQLARDLLARARESAVTERVWMKSALLERETENYAEEQNLLMDGLKLFPKFPKFYLMLGQLHEFRHNSSAAIETYLEGLKHCTHSIPLWLSLCRLEEKNSGASRARAVLEKARLRNPHNPELWLEAVRIELRAGEKRVAFNVLAKALQECPKSGILWAESIEMETVPAKKSRSVDALKKCDQDPHVILSVAVLFWQNRQIEKARIWFKRTLALDQNFGDAWAYAYKFELTYGVPEQQKEVLDQCVAAEPHQGEKWIKVSKNPKNFRWKTEQILMEVAAGIRVD